MIIIDSHVHIFESFSGILAGEPIRSEPLGKVKAGNKVFQILPPSFEKSNSRLETLIAYMDYCEVKKAVLVPNVVYGFHNEYLDIAVSQYPGRFKAIGLINVIKAKEEIDELDKIGNNKNFVGIKIDTTNGYQCFKVLNLSEKIFEPIWQSCNDLGFFVMLHLSRFEDLISLKEVIKKYKKIRFVICHLGSEATQISINSPLKNHLDILFELVSKNSNVWVDLAAIPIHYGEENYPFIETCKLIEKTYKALGPEKILWGSDYPCILLYSTYKQFVNFIINDCKRIPKKHIQMIMGLNSLSLFWDK